MKDSEQGGVLVIRTDRTGTISEVLIDGLGIADVLVTGGSLDALVHPDDRGKLATFLERLREAGSAFDWPLNVCLVGEVFTLHFAGVFKGADCMVAASRTRDRLTGGSEDLLRMSNEQTNAIRSLEKELATHRRNISLDDAAYDDISRVNNELANMQRTVAKQNAELERLNRLKDQWLGMAAHDLRGPLGVIRTYSSFLAEDTVDVLDAEHREFVGVIQRSSRFLLNLVDDLLDVSAIESGRLELNPAPVDLRQLVEDNLHLNRVLADRRDIRIELDWETKAVEWTVDRGKFDQVLNNLVGNALKYSPAGTLVRVDARPSGNGLRLSVSDTGPGIPADELDRLFRPFGRTSVRSANGEKSTGLGLSIVRRIVEAHGGRVGVRSEVGRGSTFWIEIPRKKDLAAG